MKMSGLGMYHFVECEPEDVIYQLDYNQDGLKNKEEYVQMFVDCGGNTCRMPLDIAILENRLSRCREKKVSSVMMHPTGK